MRPGGSAHKDPGNMFASSHTQHMRLGSSAHKDPGNMCASSHKKNYIGKMKND